MLEQAVAALILQGRGNTGKGGSVAVTRHQAQIDNTGAWPRPSQSRTFHYITIVMREPMLLIARMLLSETRAALLESFLESQPAEFQVPHAHFSALQAPEMEPAEPGTVEPNGKNEDGFALLSTSAAKLRSSRYATLEAHALLRRYMLVQMAGRESFHPDESSRCGGQAICKEMELTASTPPLSSPVALRQPVPRRSFVRVLLLDMFRYLDITSLTDLSALRSQPGPSILDCHVLLSARAL